MTGLDNSLKGRIALVTGASRGIGRAIAVALAETGAIVTGTATTEAGALAITKTLQMAGNNECRGLVLDVSSKDSIETLFASLKQQASMPAILINNAAITRDNLLLRMKDTEWMDVIETNLNAIFYLTRACLREMVKNRWGRIVSISSVVGSTGNPGQANYSAAKAGLEAFGRSLAMEIGSRHITVNSVAPGFIDTDMTQKLPGEQRAALMEKIPLGRPGLPEEVASAVLYLVSDGAAYVTGQTLHVNGGMYMA
jgi:3-oxoacyl-[acyl-carrier protein] reductase